MGNGSGTHSHGGARFAYRQPESKAAADSSWPPVTSEGAPMEYVVLGFVAYGLGLLTMGLLASASRIDECPAPPELRR